MVSSKGDVLTKIGPFESEKLLEDYLTLTSVVDNQLLKMFGVFCKRKGLFCL